MARKTLDQLDVPDWFSQAAEELAAAHPKWRASGQSLSLRDGSELGPETEPWVFAAWKQTEQEGSRHDLTELLRRHCAPGALDRWMSGVLAAWIAGGAPERDQWVLTATASFGGDTCVPALRAAVQRWTRDKNRLCAVRGVDVLGRIGTKAALTEVAALSVTSRSHGVAGDAAATIARRAANHGTSEAEVADDLVPDFGFDARGEVRLDFGPRQFRAALQPNLALFLLEAGGKRRTSLPPVARTDEPARAAAAKEQWSSLRTGWQRAVRAVSRRYEQGMVAGQAWHWQQLQARLGHPLLGRFLRLLIWEHSPTHRTFRIAEDGTLADAHDQPIELPAGAEVRLVHPLRLPAAELTAWQQILADYLLVQPFPQLGREALVCDVGLRDALELPAPTHESLQPGEVFGVLDHDGWRLPQTSSDVTTYMWRHFRAEDVSALLHFTGFTTGNLAGSKQRQHIQGVTFCRGARPPEGWSRSQILPLGQVPSVPFSEAHRRLLRLTAASVS